MKYFIDAEFNEDFHTSLFGRRRHFIDLISIGIVAEDGREYYAVSKDFDINAAWNKNEIKLDFGKPQGLGDKQYWLRDNVLWPIVVDAVTRYFHGDGRNKVLDAIEGRGRLGALKYIIKTFGKSNDQIAQEIIQFTKASNSVPSFYGYFADYDWVLFCSLFGKMVDLPKGFPMYCHDLQQMIDERGVETLPCNPTAHHALADARWNKKVYEEIQRSAIDIYSVQREVKEIRGRIQAQRNYITEVRQSDRTDLRKRELINSALQIKYSLQGQLCEVLEKNGLI